MAGLEGVVSGITTSIVFASILLIVAPILSKTRCMRVTLAFSIARPIIRNSVAPTALASASKSASNCISGLISVVVSFPTHWCIARFNLRAGMVLVPVGIVNERHEPPTFHGVERTFVDTVIVPTTWRDTGVGAFGDLGRGFSYRAYVVPGLDATGFSAEEGIAGRTAAGRPRRCQRSGGHRPPRISARRPHRRRESLARRRRLRADPARHRDAHGRGGDRSTRAIGAAVMSCAASGRWSTSPAPAISIARCRSHTGHQPEHREPPARRLCGSGARVSRPMPGATKWSCSAATRCSTRRTRCRRATCRSKSFSARRGSSGATYFPDPDVAFKFDVVHERNKSDGVRAPWRVNLGVGWWF